MPDREETFTVTESVMTRSVVPARGEPYQHTCDLDVYENVAHAIDDLKGGSFTYAEIRDAIDEPSSQVAVAFLKERSCILRAQRRRSVAATDCVHLDAMIEWHALREEDAAEA